MSKTLNVMKTLEENIFSLSIENITSSLDLISSFLNELEINVTLKDEFWDQLHQSLLLLFNWYFYGLLTWHTGNVNFAVKCFEQVLNEWKNIDVTRLQDLNALPFSVELLTSLFQGMHAILLANKSYNDNDFSTAERLYTEAYNSFNKSVQQASKIGNIKALFFSLGLTYFCVANIQQCKLLQLNNIDHKTVKRLSYEAYTRLKQSFFLLERLPLQQKLVHITFENLNLARAQFFAEKADEYWELGNQYLAQRKYKLAIHYFTASRIHYDIAAHFRDSIELKIQKYLSDASLAETLAQYFNTRNLQNKAIQKYQEAQTSLLQAVSEVDRLGNQSLREHFTSQIRYYKMMVSFLQGIIQYDQGNYDAAKESVYTAKKGMQNLLEKVKSVGNTALAKQIEASLAEIETYVLLLEELA